MKLTLVFTLVLLHAIVISCAQLDSVDFKKHRMDKLLMTRTYIEAKMNQGPYIDVGSWRIIRIDGLCYDEIEFFFEKEQDKSNTSADLNGISAFRDVTDGCLALPSEHLFVTVGDKSDDDKQSSKDTLSSAKKYKDYGPNRGFLLGKYALFINHDHGFSLHQLSNSNDDGKKSIVNVNFNVLPGFYEVALIRDDVDQKDHLIIFDFMVKLEGYKRKEKRLITNSDDRASFATWTVINPTYFPYDATGHLRLDNGLDILGMQISDTGEYVAVKAVHEGIVDLFLFKLVRR